MRIDVVTLLAIGAVGRHFSNDLHGNATGNLAGVITTHAIGKDHESDFTNRANRVFVMISNTTHV